MRLQELNEWGRIVKGVNTTPDVGENQIPIEAAKFGSKVDKDGKPPTLSTQVKGKSTNVLFNLGLAESIEPKTRRNYDQFVEYCCDFLELEKQPIIRLTDEIFDETFGYFDSEDDSITVSYNRRHQMDVMRTIAHELTHYRQRLDGEDLDGSDGSDHENEANAFAGVILRQWADKNPHLFKEQKFTDYELALLEGGHMPETKPARNPGRIFTALENFDNSKKESKSTSVLFNLGLTEGIRLKLERDKHMDVLHIWDTKEKHRVEVRGKKGYETNGYDPDDKLHQVLDSVGRAASVSDLMNGDIVDINPHHPQGARAIRTAKDVLQTEQELVGGKKNESISGDEMLSTFQRIHHDSGMNPSMDKWVKSQEWGIDTISPNDIVEFEDLFDYDDPFDRIIDVDESQVRRYITAIKAGRQLDPIILGPQHKDGKYSIVDGNHRALAYAALGKDIPVYMPMGNIDENFADGKKKGKSRPGRVKRSGASCNGSVTDLRKRAKKYSGERGRMYHWCANMKSGKKKK